MAGASPEAYPTVDVDAQGTAADNRNAMSDHAFLALMLAVVVFETLVSVAVAGYYGYQIRKSVERTEALTAATYLEAKKALTQAR